VTTQPTPAAPTTAPQTQAPATTQITQKGANETNAVVDFNGDEMVTIIPAIDMPHLTQVVRRTATDVIVMPHGTVTNEELTRLITTGEIPADTTELWLRKSQISDITLLANFTQLRTLYLGDNKIADISPLANLTSLTHLSLSSNPVTDLTPLGKLTNLESLTLAGFVTSDITVLRTLTNLKRLTVMSDHVTSLVPIMNLMHLESMSLAGEKLTHQQIRTIRAALPNCRVFFLPEQHPARYGQPLYG
jgi:hypothetical protein